MLETRFFYLLLFFIALVVLEWKRVHLYSDDVNLKKSIMIWIFYFCHCINMQYWLIYVLWLQVFRSDKQLVNKKEQKFFLWILAHVSEAVDVLTFIVSTVFYYYFLSLWSVAESGSRHVFSFSFFFTLLPFFPRCSLSEEKVVAVWLFVLINRTWRVGLCGTTSKKKMTLWMSYVCLLH